MGEICDRVMAKKNSPGGAIIRSPSHARQETETDSQTRGRPNGKSLEGHLARDNGDGDDDDDVRQ